MVTLSRIRSKSPSAPVIEFQPPELAKDEPFSPKLPPVTDADYLRMGGKVTNGVERLQERNVSCFCASRLIPTDKEVTNETSIYVNRVSTGVIDLFTADAISGAGAGVIAGRICMKTLHRYRAWGVPLEDAAREISPSINLASSKGIGTPLMGCTYAAISINEVLGTLRCVHAGNVRVLIINADGSPFWISREHTMNRLRRDEGEQVGDGELGLLQNNAGSGNSLLPKINHGDKFKDKVRVVPPVGTWHNDSPDSDFVLYPGQKVVIATKALFAAILPSQVAALSRGTDSHGCASALKDELKLRVGKQLVPDSRIAITVYDFIGRKKP